MGYITLKRVMGKSIQFDFTSSYFIILLHIICFSNIKSNTILYKFSKNIQEY